MAGTDRLGRLDALRAIALNEGLPIVERVHAEVERMRLVDELLDEQLALMTGESQ